jgi:tRNA threonylcarbamoyladenosine biosynthesis protein TsaE
MQRDMQRELRWSDESACEAFAVQLATRPELSSALLTFEGHLGAGKTTLVRHLLRALGVTGRIRSPSYAIVESYEDTPGPIPNIWHCDFYRFSDPREWEEAGFRDLFAQQGLKLVEWPDKAAGLLPIADLHVRLHALPDGGRSVTLEANTATGMRLLP